MSANPTSETTRSLRVSLDTLAVGGAFLIVILIVLGFLPRVPW